MTDERRYGDDEVRAIFDLASGTETSGAVGAPSQKGLTLAELQEIGREVGMDAGRIADAATRLDAPTAARMRRTSLGLPISVGRTVELPRIMTDTEWEVLLSEIRETFGARGRVSAHGNLREWTNGNLGVFLETTETGQRLRMRTLKGSAVAATRMGAVALTMSVVLAVLFTVFGVGVESLVLPVMLAALGFFGIGSSVLTLPPWAREREEQMEYLADRALSLTGRESE